MAGGSSSSSGSGAGATVTATGAGTRVDVTLKLPQLQNLAKRDPAAYRSDYEAQIRRLESELGILSLQPGSVEPSSSLVELIQFAAAVSSSSYRGAESDRIANLLMGLLLGRRQGSSNLSETTTTASSEASSLDSHKGNKKKKNKKASSSAANVVALDLSAMPAAALQLHKQVRKTCVSALILMRNKGVVAPLVLLQLFFRLMAVIPDKALREVLYAHLVNDIRNLNKKGKRDDAVNRSVQSFLHKIVSRHGTTTTTSDAAAEEAATDVAAKRATDLVCELYRRRVWTDERAVAILATAVQSPNTTVMCRAMRFFLNIEEKMAWDAAQQQEAAWNDKCSAVDYHLHSKKTASRQRQTQRQLKNRKKAQLQKETAAAGEDWMESANPAADKGVEASKKLYPAIELLRDPQGLAEHVLKKVRSGKSFKYEVKVLMINFMTRLVGNHELLVLPLYPFLQKYLQGHQRDVTAILAYTVQACHEQVPPEEVFGILKVICHNFITERCSEEQMAVGINAARAICARVPSTLSMEDENDDSGSATAAVSMDVEAFCRDLAAYSNHRDRSVSIAGKAWTNFVRQVHPGLLQGKDRGMKGAALYRAGTKPLRYGETKAAAGVEGADLLLEYEFQKQKKKEAAAAAQLQSSGGDDDNDSDEDVEEEDEEIEMAGGDNEDDDSDDEAPNLILLDDNNDESANSKPAAAAEEGEEEDVEAAEEDHVDMSKRSTEERDKVKQELSSTRIFSASDFAKMRKLVEREKRARQDPREAARRKRAIARGEEFEALSDDDSDDDDDASDDEEQQQVHVAGAVNPAQLMAEAKRKRQSKAEKLEKIIAGRTQFETKQREGGSTNIEKKRKKNFQMSKFSRDARSKGRGKASLYNNKKRTAGAKLQKGHEAKKRRRKL